MAKLYRINRRPMDDSSADEAIESPVAHMRNSTRDRSKPSYILASKLQQEPVVPSLKHVDDHINEFRKGVYTVTDGVYVAIGYGLANSICVETRTGLVIIDVLEDVGFAREVCREFKRLTSNKPIKSIIFTHAHFDHVAGIKGFIENEPKQPMIYAHAECSGHAHSNGMFKYGNTDRIFRQFGTMLADEVPCSREKNWYKNAGIGAALHSNEHSAVNASLITTFHDKHTFYQDDVQFEMVAAPGETDDQIMIHIPSKSLLLPGDNIYRAFPNLYAIRGVEPRDAYSWYKSIEKMIDFVERHHIQHLAPSHSRHISGYEQIRDTLNVYRDGIAFVHDQTIRWLNQGFSQNEIVEQIQATKPKELFEHCYLLEFYGTIEWSVRAIYMKNMGWFSGKVDDLFPCSKAVRSKGMMRMMQYFQNRNEGGHCATNLEEKMVGFIECCYANTKHGQSVGYLEGTTNDERNRFLLELTTQCIMALDSKPPGFESFSFDTLHIGQHLDCRRGGIVGNQWQKGVVSQILSTKICIRFNSGDHIAFQWIERVDFTDNLRWNATAELMDRVKEIRWAVIRDMASYQTSAPARNYLLSYWLEEKYDIESNGGGDASDITMNSPLSPMLCTLPFHVDPIKCQQNIKGVITGIIEMCDIQQIFKMRLKEEGVMYMQQVDAYEANDDDIDWILKTKELDLKQLINTAISKSKNGSNGLKRGHMIPRIRSRPGVLMAVLLGMVTGMVSVVSANNSNSNGSHSANGLIKGRDKALEFFGCLEFAVISKLSINPSVTPQDDNDQNVEHQIMESVETGASHGISRVAESVNFSGTWQLESNHNLDTFLKSQGVGFAKRKISSIASVTLKIEHNGDSLRVETQTSFKNWSLDMNIDGNDQETDDPVTGEKIRFNLSWKSEAKRIMVIRIYNLSTKRTITNERSMPTMNELRENMVNDKGATMLRVFKRVVDLAVLKSGMAIVTLIVVATVVVGVMVVGPIIYLKPGPVKEVLEAVKGAMKETDAVYKGGVFLRMEEKWLNDQKKPTKVVDERKTKALKKLTVYGAEVEMSAGNEIDEIKKKDSTNMVIVKAVEFTDEAIATDKDYQVIRTLRAEVKLDRIDKKGEVHFEGGPEFMETFIRVLPSGP